MGKIIFILLIFTFCVAGNINAQSEIDSTGIADSIAEVNSEQTYWQSLDKGVYLDLSLLSTPHPESKGLAFESKVGLSLGLFNFGVFRNRNQSAYKKTLIFPNQFNLDYIYGGVFLGVKVFQSAHFEAQVQGNYGKGDMTWTQDGESDVFFRDEFELIHPSVKISYLPFKFMNVYVQGGIRIMRELELSGVQNEDFSGLCFGLGLSIGLYNE